MNEKNKKIYTLSLDWLKNNTAVIIDNNIIEYTCLYNNTNINRQEIYQELIKILIKEKVNIIMQLLLVINLPQNTNNTIWDPYKVYLNALRFAIQQVENENLV